MTYIRRTRVLVALLVSWSVVPAVWAQSDNAQGPANLPLYATRQNQFAIPFNVNRQVAQPVEVHLYVSSDRGTNWNLEARQPPHARQFAFRAPHDGEYWFASRTIDATSAAADQSTLRPELRVVVDTVTPQIDITVRTLPSGEVLTTWQIFDQNLLASSLKLEYQGATGEPWQNVALELPRDEVLRNSFRGQSTWWPETRSATVNIRAEVRDRAGNLGTASRRLLLPALVTQQQQHSTAGRGLPGLSPGAVPWPSDSRPPGGNATAPALPTGQMPRRAAPMFPTANGPTAPPDPGPLASSGAGGMYRPDRAVPAQTASSRDPGSHLVTVPSSDGTGQPWPESPGPPRTEPPQDQAAPELAGAAALPRCSTWPTVAGPLPHVSTHPRPTRRCGPVRRAMRRTYCRRENGRR